jgi:alkanesulfonate monooxygenase SsuD/methylene tetrahydromethanopterin reductase-like flavin-dependent oxidoreductase (luciferase family)
LARPYVLAMVTLRTGGDLQPQVSVEEAERTELSESHRALAAQLSTRWVIGTPESTLAELEQLAQTYGVDEIMVHPVAGSLAQDPLRESPGREATIQLLSAQLATHSLTA